MTDSILTISEMTERFKVDVFAYVLMSNHLLVRTNRTNLKKAMQWVWVVICSRGGIKASWFKMMHMLRSYPVISIEIH